LEADPVGGEEGSEEIIFQGSLVGSAGGALGLRGRGRTGDPGRHPESRLRFHEATALTRELPERLQHTARKRVLRHFARHGLLEPYEAEDVLGWDHGDGFSLDATVRTEATDREGLGRLIRYWARPPFALERLHLVGGRSDQILYVLPKPDLAGRHQLDRRQG